MYNELRGTISNVEDDVSHFNQRNYGTLESMVWSENYEERLHAKEFRFLYNRYAKGPTVLLLTDMVGCMEWLKANTNMK